MASEAALIARLEVKLTTLERQLKQAGVMADKAVTDIEKKFASANPRLGGAAAFGTFLGTLAGAGVQVAIRALQDMARDMRELGQAAELTGLSLQEVYSIQQAIGGQAGEVNAALGSIANLLDKAQRGQKNALSEIFRVNQVDLASIKDAGDAMTKLADIMSRLTAVQAQDLGKALGMTPEVVANIREAGAAFEESTAKAAAMAPDLEALARLAKDFEDSWERAIGKIKALMLSGFAAMKGVVLDFLKDTAMVLETIETVQNAIRSMAGITGKTGLAGQAAEELRSKIAANEPAEGGPLVVNVGGRRAAAPLPPSGGGRGGGRGRGEQTDDVERYLQQLQKSNDLLVAEAANLGKGNVERAEAVALAKLHAEAREAGRAPTEAEIADTLRLAAANETLKTSIERTEDAYRAVNAEAQSFAQSLVRDLNDGVDAADALGNALENLAERLQSRAMEMVIDALLPKSGGGGLFNMLPKFQSGGVVPGSGPVPIMAHGGEVVVPKSIARGGGSNVEINIVNNANADITQRQSQGPSGPRIEFLIQQAAAQGTATPGNPMHTAVRTFGGGMPLTRR